MALLPDSLVRSSAAAGKGSARRGKEVLGAPMASLAEAQAAASVAAGGAIPGAVGGGVAARDSPYIFHRQPRTIDLERRGKSLPTRVTSWEAAVASKHQRETITARPGAPSRTQRA